MSPAITPDEAFSKAAEGQHIPNEVFEVFNELIVKNLRDGKARIQQDEAVTMIEARMTVQRQDIYGNRWLDVEDAYRAQGWAVDYDKPAYNETHSATFTFRRST
jgi:hypothetical protein